jgi:hypothetical protein
MRIWIALYKSPDGVQYSIARMESRSKFILAASVAQVCKIRSGLPHQISKFWPDACVCLQIERN